MKRRFYLAGVVLAWAGLAFSRSLIAGEREIAAAPPASPQLLQPVAQVPVVPFDAPTGAWTLVVLPDTQHYLAGNPEVFQRQVDWIVAHRESHHILFAAHEGDITNNNSPEHWTEVRKIMDGLNRAGIPYSLAPGNKDLGPGGTTADRTTLMNEYFKASDYRASQAVGFFEEGHRENSWHTFDTPTGPHLLVALEFGPRDDVLAWAGKVVEQHPKHAVVVVTHACLYHDGTLHGSTPKQGANPKNYGLAKVGSVNDGVDMWTKFVSHHPNIRLVLNGHATGPGAACLCRLGDAGNPVYHILANYQRGVIPDRGYGGGGYLRLMRFHPDGRTVEVKTYSPWYDDWLKTPDQQFTLIFPETAK